MPGTLYSFLSFFPTHSPTKTPYYYFIFSTENFIFAHLKNVPDQHILTSKIGIINIKLPLQRGNKSN